MEWSVVVWVVKSTTMEESTADISRRVLRHLLLRGNAPFSGNISAASQHADNWLSTQWTSYERLKDLALKVVFYSILLVVFAWAVTILSVLLYTIFYFFYVPTALHRFPLHFNYGCNTEKQDIGPIAVLPLIEGSTRLLARNQGYDLYFSAVLPESSKNFESGMFMVSLALASSRAAAVGAVRTGTGIDCYREHHSAQTPDAHLPRGMQFPHDSTASISRSGVLKYRSWLHHAMRTAVFSVPLVLGVVDESQTMELPLFDNVFDNATHPYTWAAVSISKSSVQLYASELRFHAHFTGATYFMHDWFYSSFFVGVVSTGVFLVLATLCGVYIYTTFWGENDSTTTASRNTTPSAPPPPAFVTPSAAELRAAAARDPSLHYVPSSDIVTFRPPVPDGGEESTTPPRAQQAGDSTDDDTDGSAVSADDGVESSPRQGAPQRPRSSGERAAQAAVADGVRLRHTSVPGRTSRGNFI